MATSSGNNFYLMVKKNLIILLKFYYKPVNAQIYKDCEDYDPKDLVKRATGKQG